MDVLNDLLDRLFAILYDNILLPVLHGVAAFLDLLISPLAGHAPALQIAVVAVVAAVISRLLAHRFKSKREKQLQAAFKAKLGDLKHTRELGDARLEKVVRKGLHQEADQIYEKIVLDKFVEMGISYFFPMFFFLIWLEYSRFTPEALQRLTGSPFAWETASGARLSAAYTFVWVFNISLLVLWLLELGVRWGLRKTKRSDAN